MRPRLVASQKRRWCRGRCASADARFVRRSESRHLTLRTVLDRKPCARNLPPHWRQIPVIVNPVYCARCCAASQPYFYIAETELAALAWDTPSQNHRAAGYSLPGGCVSRDSLRLDASPWERLVILAVGGLAMLHSSGVCFGAVDGILVCGKKGCALSGARRRGDVIGRKGRHQRA